MGSKYKPEKNLNPGPAQYDVSESLTKTAGTGVRISKAQRKEIWDAQTRKDVPGPGNYSENTSSFAQVKGGAANMGSKYRDEVNVNPGPGQYEQALFDMSNYQANNVKIGTQKARIDLFSVEQAANQPGPGQYESPEKQAIAFTMGQKREARIENTPGVGSYNANSELTVSKEASVKISQAKREELWKDELKTAQTPGPGAQDPYDPPS
mmetsp:Transcript_14602/g.19762  ORF Transcript_14602/g.19762 Transcript_14602/m.19762 type:complete len:209 (-) Transcript_14602:264-890(-)